MWRVALVAIVFASILALASPAACQDDLDAASNGAAFRVDLPEGAVLTRRAVIDFEIYQVALDGKPIAGFYEGFAANVSDWVSNRRLAHRQQRELPDGGADFFWSRGCMPTEVHGWIFPSLSDVEAERARAIMDSLRMRPCG